MKWQEIKSLYPYQFVRLDRKKFSPDWRDDIVDQEAIKLSLIMPEDTKPNGYIWVTSKSEYVEELFGKQYRNTTPRTVKAIVRRSEKVNRYTLVSEDGREMEKDHPVFDLIFHPKAWMTDSAEERCTMYAAAKLAKGDILVGGLGLAIYPQMVFKLERPVESLSIIEKSPVIIEFIRNSWLKSCDDNLKDRIQIIEDTIENYLEKTDRSFDTIYLDTWEDSDPRLLAHVNYLVKLAAPKLKEDGQIQCWGYALMVKAFLEEIKLCEEHNFSVKNVQGKLDPVLETYVKWRENRDQEMSIEMIEKKAKKIATSVAKLFAENEKEGYFTPYRVRGSGLFPGMGTA
jgi:spermidine synthase